MPNTNTEMKSSQTIDSERFNTSKMINGVENSIKKTKTKTIDAKIRPNVAENIDFAV